MAPLTPGSFELTLRDLNPGDHLYGTDHVALVASIPDGPSAWVPVPKAVADAASHWGEPTGLQAYIDQVCAYLTEPR